MKTEFKIRVYQYLKAITVIVILSLLLAIGPCGGWIVGLITGLFLGVTLTTTFWLLNFKWYWNVVCGFKISLITLTISISIIKQIQFENKETISNLLSVVIILIVFVGLTEFVNKIGKRIFKSKDRLEEVGQ